MSLAVPGELSPFFPFRLVFSDTTQLVVEAGQQNVSSPRDMAAASNLVTRGASLRNVCAPLLLEGVSHQS
jgi:hypothetical protein